MEEPRSTRNHHAPPPSSLSADTLKKLNHHHESSTSRDVCDGGDAEVGRERLKRHREEVAGNVKVPEKWGQEQMMKDWIEFSTFDALLGSNGMITAARDALIADARKAKSPRLRIQSSY